MALARIKLGHEALQQAQAVIRVIDVFVVVVVVGDNKHKAESVVRTYPPLARVQVVGALNMLLM